MLKVPYIGPMMLTARLLAIACAGAGRGTFFGPNWVHSQVSARSADCHWSSSIVRGRNRWMLVPSGVTPPPIISAIEPVTTTAGRSGSSVAQARFIAPSVPSRPSSCSPRPGDDDRQLVRRQPVGVVQHRGDRQVLAADRPVDDDLQALDRGERVDRAPVAAGPIVIEDQRHVPMLSSALAAAMRLAANLALNSGRSTGVVSHTPAE